MAKGKSGRAPRKKAALSSQQAKKGSRSCPQTSLLPSSKPSSPPAAAKQKGRRPRVESSPAPPTSEQENSDLESEPRGGNSDSGNESERHSDGMIFTVYISSFSFLSLPSIVQGPASCRSSVRTPRTSAWHRRDKRLVRDDTRLYRTFSQ